MKRILITVTLILFAAVAFADQESKPILAAAAPHSENGIEYSPSLSGADLRIIPLQGGDNLASATPITEFPAEFTGTTIGYTDDYDEFCPWGGSTSPDVVYSYIPDAPMQVRISLCDSDYDTKIFVYEEYVFNMVGCNEDYCGTDGYKSEIPDLHLNAGTTYYIVIDGYGGASGNYQLLFTYPSALPSPCPLEMPPGALIEDEPLCYDGFQDTYNGGCQPNPVVWDSISSGDIIFGHSGTFLYDGLPIRDTDWYEFETNWTSALHLEGMAEFPLQIVLLRQFLPQPCDDYQVLKYAISPACTTAVIDTIVPEGRYWAWVGPSVFEGIECGYSYILSLQYAHTDTCDIIAGDANSDGVASGVDVIFMVNWLKGGPIPPPDICQCPGNLYAAADFNANCNFNGLDVTAAVNFFKGCDACLPLICPSCPPGN